jgi:hypothetical protein
MLRTGLISAGIGAAASLLVGGCAGAQLPSLPLLPQIAAALTPSPVVGPPTDIYARVARGAMACWFAAGGPLKANYVYHGEAQPASQGGKADIIIHERNRASDNPRGLPAFRISIVPDGEASALTIENVSLPDPLGKAMEQDVHRWAAGALGCQAGGDGWTPRATDPPENPSTLKPRAKKGRAT